MVTIKLDVIVDTCCPFCFIAQKRITKAIAAFKQQHNDDTVIVNWLPFLLRPDAPKVSAPLSVFIESKFGRGSFDNVMRREEELGRSVGIKFNRNRLMGNTVDSHRLIYLAGKKPNGMQSLVVEKLMSGHFEGGQDLASRDFLLQAASEAGIETKEASEWLDSGAGADEVEAKVMNAVASGVRAVPNITIADRYPMTGHYDESTILATLERVRRDNGA